MDDAAPHLADRMAYPPEPWALNGEAHMAAWLLPADALAVTPPPGFRLLRIGGRLMVGGVWAQYREPGVLAYDELAVGVVVRRGLALAVTLPWVWVDSPVSQRGGRALWAIPKGLASFGGVRRPAFEIRAQVDGETLAACRFAPTVRAPGRWPIRLRLAQAAGAEARVTQARIRGRLAFGRSAWRGAGPLGALDGRPPLLSLRLEDAEMLFGGRTGNLR